MGKYEKCRSDNDFMSDKLASISSERVVKGPEKSLDLSLCWRITHATDGVFEVDLNRFSAGDLVDGYVGRPTLIDEAAPHIKLALFGRSKSTVETQMVRLKKFFRFLTIYERETGIDVQSFLEIESGTGAALKSYLLRLPGKNNKEKQRTLSSLWRLAVAAREVLSSKLEQPLAVPMWPTIVADEVRLVQANVDTRAIKAIYSVAKRTVDSGVSFREHGCGALIRGHDPRVFNSTGNIPKGHKRNVRHEVWYNLDNLSVLARIRMASLIINEIDLDASDINRQQNRASASGKLLTDFYKQHGPSLEEATAACTLVTLHTGWMDTARNINVVDKNFFESDDWFVERSPQHLSDRLGSMMVLSANRSAVVEANARDLEVDIHAIRPKTGRIHAALSTKRSRYHPFRVIQNQIERTRFLRDCLRKLRSQIINSPRENDPRHRDLLIIERKLRSPWLFFNPLAKGHLAIGLVGLGDKFSTSFRNKIVAKAVLELRARSKHDLAEAVNRLVVSDIRDGFAGHGYDQSGGNIFVVQQMLRHKSIKTTQFYLRQKRQIEQHFRSFQEMCQCIFEEIHSDRGVDPTILSLLSSGTGITDEDRTLLKEFRSRSQMQCADPLNPPSDIAPNHRAGTYCEVQRCVLCRHARLTPEAIPLLALRYAEILEIAQIVPTHRFINSSFEIERQTIEVVRSETFPILGAQFDQLVQKYRSEIRGGNAKIFEALPLMEIKTEFSKSVEQAL